MRIEPAKRESHKENDTILSCCHMPKDRLSHYLKEIHHTSNMPTIDIIVTFIKTFPYTSNRREFQRSDLKFKIGFVWNLEKSVPIVWDNVHFLYLEICFLWCDYIGFMAGISVTYCRQDYFLSPILHSTTIGQVYPILLFYFVHF